MRFRTAHARVDYPMDTFDPTKHWMQERVRTVGSLLDSIASGVIRHTPVSIGDVAVASSLVENLILHAPVNPVVLREARVGLDVVDGSWRVSVMRSFMDGTLVLANMTYFPEFNGMTRYEVNPLALRRFLEAQVRATVVTLGMNDAMADRYVAQINQRKG